MATASKLLKSLDMPIFCAICCFGMVMTLGVLMPQIASAEVYRWVDENGKVYFSDKPSRSQKSESVDLKVNTVESVTYNLSSVDSGKKVIMYSTSWCGVCKKAKRYFDNNGIKYKEYDIEKDAFGKAAYKKLNAKGVPVILVGNRQMNGFSESGFEQLYQ